MSENGQREKIGGLWQRTSRQGNAYLTGTINGQQVIVFAAKEKRSDKSPDFQVFKSEPYTYKPKEQQAGDEDRPF